MSAPAAETMADGAPMGAEGFGQDIAKTMTDRHNFKIVHNVPQAGCCRAEVWCNACNPDLKGRGYLVIGENFVESNNPIPVCCCLSLDCIAKTYMDRAPFADTCCEKLCGSCGAGASYYSEEDVNYCCYCFNCICIYNLCTKPCVGGMVGRHSFKRDTCCFKCDTRCFGGVCCGGKLMGFVGDSAKASDTLQAAVGAFRARGGRSGDIAGDIGMRS